MLLRLLKAERMKLKRSPVWLAFLFMPVVPALLGTINYMANIEILQSGNKKSLPNVKSSSDTWRRRWDSPAPLQQSAGLLQPGGTQSAGHGLFESHLAALA